MNGTTAEIKCCEHSFDPWSVGPRGQPNRCTESRGRSAQFSVIYGSRHSRDNAQALVQAYDESERSDMPSEFQTLTMRCKSTGVVAKDRYVTLTLEMSEATPSIAQLLSRLVVDGSEVQVVVDLKPK